MATTIEHNRLGRSLIEAAAIARALHAAGSTPIVRHLQAQVDRALEEYTTHRFPSEPTADQRIEADVQLAVVKLQEWMAEMEKKQP